MKKAREAASSTFPPSAAKASAARGTTQGGVSRVESRPEMLTKALAVELNDDGIRVNAVEPGPTHSDLDKDLPPEAFEQIEKKMPMHRFAEPIEIGALCVFLSTEAANHITGAVHVHDGGLVLGG